MARVLVIDDDPELLDTLRDVLRQAGHEVSVASSIPGGLREYRQRGADVVVTDLYVPEPDGLALIRDLGADVNVIAISGASQRGELNALEDAEAFGAWRTLSKPFLSSALLALVEEATRR